MTLGRNVKDGIREKVETYENLIEDSRATLRPGMSGSSSLVRNESGTAQVDTSFQVPQRTRSGDSDSDSRSPLKL